MSVRPTDAALVDVVFHVRVEKRQHPFDVAPVEGVVIGLDHRLGHPDLPLQRALPPAPSLPA